MRRAVILLALLGAMTLVLSAPMAQADTNRVSCTSNEVCRGTNNADRLLDKAGQYTDILGKDGDDTYVERSGGSDRADTLEDHSYTSDDAYYIANKNFNTVRNDALWIIDYGGDRDLLDLSPTGYSHTDCTPYPTDARGDGSRDDLYIDCPGRDDIIVFDYYTTNSIEKFKFSDGTFDGPSQSNYTSNSVTTQEQASKDLPNKKQSGTVSNQAQKNASSADSWGQDAAQTGETTTQESTTSGS